MPSKETYVPDSQDIQRVAFLPRRDWRVGADDLATRATDLLRTSKACPGCGQARGAHLRSASGLPCPFRHIPLSLYSHQAAFLVEFAAWSGLLAPMGVGRGKTLSGFLSFTVGQSLRPMLVLQAGLIEKAKLNQAALSQFWKIPNWIKIVSYEVLGRVSGKDELLKYQPDMIVFDEVHKLKSRKAAVTKRVERYVMHHHTHRLQNPNGSGHVVGPGFAMVAGPLPVHGNPLPTAADLRAPVIAEHNGADGKQHDRSCELCKARVQPKGFGQYGLRVIGMSGTITTQTPKDFAHIAHMCLPGGNAPVPSTYVELDRWHLALGASVTEGARLHPGVLLQAFCDARENGLDPTQAARKGYGRRLFETPGVVGTTDDGVKASLQIGAHDAPASAAIDDAFAMLRGDRERCQVNWDLESIARGEPAHTGDIRYSGWKLPPCEGHEQQWQCVDGIEIYRHALELALGFFYIPKEKPPPYWLEARGYWRRFVRSRISLGKLDSELEVANAALAFPVTIDEMRASNGEDPHKDPRVGGAHPYTHWVTIRDSYRLEKKATWICDSVLKSSADWLHSNSRGILWTRHVAFGKRLAEFCNVPYFGQEGRDAKGVYLDQVALASDKFNGPIIASLDANKTGRDLQFKWDKNLFMTAMSDGAECQQSLARTHREGTDADVVEADMFMGCIEHAAAFEKAMSRARYIEDMTTEKQRLNFADVLVPSADAQAEKHGRSFRWNK